MKNVVFLVLKCNHEGLVIGRIRAFADSKSAQATCDYLNEFSRSRGLNSCYVLEMIEVE